MLADQCQLFPCLSNIIPQNWTTIISLDRIKHLITLEYKIEQLQVENDGPKQQAIMKIDIM